MALAPSFLSRLPMAPDFDVPGVDDPRQLLAARDRDSKKPHRLPGAATSLHSLCAEGLLSYLTCAQWNCSSSVEPVSALTLEEPPWITVVTSSK
jgi:hypothetical protein